MTKIRVIEMVEESTFQAKLDAWFAGQVLKSPDNLESTARQIITLVTALLGVLFTVLAVAGDPLPYYFVHPAVHWLGAASVILLLLALLAALVVLWPRRIEVASAKPQDQAKKFDDMVKCKASALKGAGVSFFFGLVALGSVLVIAIIEVK